MLSVTRRFWTLFNMINRLSIAIHPFCFLWWVIALYLVPLQWLFSWILAAMLHELGHYIALVSCGGTLIRISIRGNGCIMHTSPLSLRREIFCIAAGPLAGIFILLFYRYLPRTCLCAAAQTIYNLLPIYPLDGGRILRCLIQERKRPCKQTAQRVQ